MNGMIFSLVMQIRKIRGIFTFLSSSLQTFSLYFSLLILLSMWPSDCIVLSHCVWFLLFWFFLTHDLYYHHNYIFIPLSGLLTSFSRVFSIATHWNTVLARLLEHATLIFSASFSQVLQSLQWYLFSIKSLSSTHIFLNFHWYSLCILKFHPLDHLMESLKIIQSKVSKLHQTNLTSL